MITSMDLGPIIRHNPTLGGAICVQVLSAGGPTPESREVEVDPDVQMAAREGCVSVLSSLPPTLSSFDLFGRLLRDDTPVQQVQGQFGTTRGGRETVGDVVRIYALGAFLQNCIAWIEHASAEERRGEGGGDDRVVQGVANVRFVPSFPSPPSCF